MTRESKQCQACEASNPAAARFCCRCGASLGEAVIRSTTRVSPLMERWRRLSHRLTRAEVRKILGEPAHIGMPHPREPMTIEKWIYEYESTAEPDKRVTGTVTISIVESRLLAWQEPDWSRLQEA